MSKFHRLDLELLWHQIQAFLKRPPKQVIHHHHYHICMEFPRTSYTVLIPNGMSLKGSTNESNQ